MNEITSSLPFVTRLNRCVIVLVRGSRARIARGRGADTRRLSQRGASLPRRRPFIHGRVPPWSRRIEFNRGPLAHLPARRVMRLLLSLAQSRSTAKHSPPTTATRLSVTVLRPHLRRNSQHFALADKSPVRRQCLPSLAHQHHVTSFLLRQKLSRLTSAVHFMKQ